MYWLSGVKKGKHNWQVTTFPVIPIDDGVLDMDAPDYSEEKAFQGDSWVVFFKPPSPPVHPLTYLQWPVQLVVTVSWKNTG